VSVVLPPSLKLKTTQYRRARTADVQAKRADFSKNAKPSFLQYLAEHHIEELYAMGLTNVAIDYMRNGELPRNHPGEQLDCSIDHIISLNFGGTNDFENLVMVPTRINALKDKLETAQIKGDEGIMETIVPANDTKIPFIEGGFKRAKANA
jgi:hypothetical protein